eukprot:648210_1
MDPTVRLVLIVYTCIVQFIEGQWISSSDWFLPHPDFQMSIGAHNDILTIFGGNFYPLDLTTYNISSHVITGFGRVLPTYTRGYSQYWTQMGHIVLMLDSYSPVINSYDLSTNIFTQQWKGITIPKNITIYTGCIASTQDALFIVGGANETKDVYFDTFFIYYLNKNTWDSGPSISLARSRHSCIVSEWSDTLFVIGGHYHYTQTRRIEYISVHNTTENTWTILNHNLGFRSWGVRSVSYHQYIYIISGSDDTYSNTVHIIDTERNSLSVAPHSLVYGVSYSTPVIVNDRLYVFGGRISYGVSSSRLQYLDLPRSTITPTSTTTSTPTSVPTPTPTLIPIHFPTLTPTLLQTSFPTSIPTSIPTYFPTLFPSSTPTSFPTTTYNISSTSNNDISMSPLDDNGNMTSKTSQPPIQVKSTRFWIIIVVGSINIILFVCCVYYIVTKLPTRSTDSDGIASPWDALKSP